MQEMDEMCLVTHQNPAQVVLCAHSNDTIYTSFLWGLWSSPVDEACPTTFLRQILPFPKGKWFEIFCDKSFFFFLHAHSTVCFLPSHPLEVSASLSSLWWKIHSVCSEQAVEQTDPSKDNSIFLRILNVWPTKTHGLLEIQCFILICHSGVMLASCLVLPTLTYSSIAMIWLSCKCH